MPNPPLPKVVLIRGPTAVNERGVARYAAPAVGLAYIASSLLEAGFPVQVIDALGEAVHQYSRVPGLENSLLHGLRFAEICDRILPETKVIGLSVMFSRDWLISRALIQELRKRFPES